MYLFLAMITKTILIESNNPVEAVKKDLLSPVFKANKMLPWLLSMPVSIRWRISLKEVDITLVRKLRKHGIRPKSTVQMMSPLSQES